ncbi:MAG: peptidase [Acidobacteria bacterium]|nr:peptidase [Acidobacteriota bacterium]
MSAKLAAALLVALLLPVPSMAAQVIVVNGDPPGVGFNDPTPAVPVGGNPGTTVGEQALYVFQTAAQIWGHRLVSTQPILVISFFTPLTCTATSAVLGAAGANWYFANVEPAVGGQALAPDTWYPAALAEKLTRQDIVADPNDPYEVFSVFNSELGKPGCLTGRGWYYGVDNNEPSTNIDLLAVVLHEFGHGLGFSVGPTSSNTGARALGFPSIWEGQMLDTTTGKRWIDMSDPERAASARNNQNLVWAGQKASNVVPSTLAFGTQVNVLEPASLGSAEAVPASFGPQLRPGGVRAALVAPDDGGGGSTRDGCEPFPQPGLIAGNVVLMDRGTCAFTVKVKNAQNAGAVAAVVANNTAGPLAMGGADPTVVIPAVGITQVFGAALRVAAPALVHVGRNVTVRAGTVLNFPRLYAPTGFAQGSSVSHWDTSATPNMLMEPFINLDLTSSVKNPDDLTWSLLRDIGW